MHASVCKNVWILIGYAYIFSVFSYFSLFVSGFIILFIVHGDTAVVEVKKSDDKSREHCFV